MSVMIKFVIGFAAIQVILQYALGGPFAGLAAVIESALICGAAVSGASMLRRVGKPIQEGQLIAVRIICGLAALYCIWGFVGNFFAVVVLSVENLTFFIRGGIRPALHSPLIFSVFVFETVSWGISAIALVLLTAQKSSSSPAPADKSLRPA